MSKCYLLTVQPTDPYFFGNEKTFSFDSDASGHYFIKSERMPLQTTLLGALRYLLLPVKNADYQYTRTQQQKNQSIIGTDSFQISGPKQSFGVIEHISPVFLVNGQDKYVRTPFDHITRITDRYTPMTEHREVITDRGIRWYFPDFSAKDGLSDSYMHTVTGALVDAGEIFSPDLQLGITKGSQENGLYKKQRIRMQSPWAFGVYVTLDTQRIAQDPDAQAAFDALTAGTVAYLGQNKSAFTATLYPEENTLSQELSRHLQPGAVYCLGDTLASGDIYDCCRFAVTQLRDYRAYRTVFADDGSNYVGRISKEACLYRLICAGSVLITDNKKNLAACIGNENCLQIGFNTTVPNLEE